VYDLNNYTHTHICNNMKFCAKSISKHQQFIIDYRFDIMISVLHFFLSSVSFLFFCLCLKIKIFAIFVFYFLALYQFFIYIICYSSVIAIHTNKQTHIHTFRYTQTLYTIKNITCILSSYDSIIMFFTSSPPTLFLLSFHIFV